MNKVKSKKSIEGTQRQPQVPLLQQTATPIKTLYNSQKDKGDSNVEAKQATSRDITKADYEAYYY